MLAPTRLRFLDEQTAALEEAVPGKFNINSRLRYEVFDLDNGVDALDRDGTSLRVRYVTPRRTSMALLQWLRVRR